MELISTVSRFVANAFATSVAPILHDRHGWTSRPTPHPRAGFEQGNGEVLHPGIAAAVI